MRLPIIVCSVDTAEGKKDYVTCLSQDEAFSRGLAPEAIIGALLRPLEPGESISPRNFARNRQFVEFLHSLIARRCPQFPGLMAEAERQGIGWVYVIDQRTPTPWGAVPPEDILGAFEVKNGLVVPNSYKPNPNHMILSASGFLQLDPDLQACLFEELAKLGDPEGPHDLPRA